jgi:hypothetical protein
MAGRVLGSATSQSVGESLTFYYVSSTVTQAIYLCTYSGIVVTDCRYRIRVASSSGFAQFFKAPSGIAIASGTAITNTIDLGSTPTADTTIIVPLLAGAGLTLAPGDSIGVVFTGTMTSGVGLLQVYVEPLI